MKLRAACCSVTTFMFSELCTELGLELLKCYLLIAPNICINSKPLYFHLIIIAAYMYFILLGCYQEFWGAAYVGFF